MMRIEGGFGFKRKFSKRLVSLYPPHISTNAPMLEKCVEK